MMGAMLPWPLLFAIVSWPQVPATAVPLAASPEAPHLEIQPEIQLDFELAFWHAPGTFLPVTVQHEGRRVPAEVRLLRLNEKSQWRTAERGRQLQPGSYLVDVDEDGTYALSARAPGLGTAFLPSIDVRSRDVAQPIVLSLVGEHSLSGRLVDPLGAPVLGHGVRAVSSKMAGTTHVSTNQALDHERGDGCSHGTATTDENGAFEITGLQPGDYRLLGWEASSYGDTSLLGAQVSAGSKGLEFTVRRHALVVRAVDHLGQSVDLRALHRRTDRFFSASNVLAYCYPSVPRDGEHFRSPWSTTRGPYLIAQLTPGREYVLGLHSPEYPAQEARVTLAEGSFQTELRIELPKPTDPATLHIEPLRPGGSPFPIDSTRIAVSNGAGRELFSWDRVAELERTMPLRLPAGRYRVHVEEDSAYPRHMAVTREVTLKEDEVLRLPMELGAAGFLGLDVKAGPSSAPGRPRTHVRAELTPVGGGETRVLKFPHQGRFVLSHPAPDPWIPVGKRLRASGPIPVGEYTLKLTLYGYETYERRVVVEQGRRAWVTATLECR